MTVIELVMEQIQTLPDEDIREVVDFIGYLKQKEDRAQWLDLMLAQESSLQGVWDNAEDEVWNDL
ncbi:DUF2281 domain-containing protein [Lamprobacter modestohalophilus]|uniref:DUF2281 domain-containing protein n=1 Tax=Chromatiaceae TaxID=1046 RepID=UPI00142A1603|nr:MULTISPECIES: DUF2281 domain-containing protein [Chromatiaceae]MBK5938870.1 hypothetical protein [Halochromatium roseum]MEA1050132.1 DUF2281 domain-containing protein [Lamprobacter modestohalophilus]NEX17974.1 hypothetical protein [Halochromatium sp.]